MFFSMTRVPYKYLRRNMVSQYQKKKNIVKEILEKRFISLSKDAC